MPWVGGQRGWGGGVEGGRRAGGSPVLLEPPGKNQREICGFRNDLSKTFLRISIATNMLFYRVSFLQKRSHSPLKEVLEERMNWQNAREKKLRTVLREREKCWPSWLPISNRWTNKYLLFDCFHFALHQELSQIGS